MSILHNNRMDSQLQHDLGEYGLFRQKVVDGAKKLPKNEIYFGMKGSSCDDEVQLFFPKNNIDEIDTKDGMELGQLVPAGTNSYNMLEPAQFGKSLSMKSPNTIKNYLRKLLESV